MLGKNGTAVFKSAKPANEAEKTFEPEGFQIYSLKHADFVPTFCNHKSQMCSTNFITKSGDRQGSATQS